MLHAVAKRGFMVQAVSDFLGSSDSMSEEV